MKYLSKNINGFNTRNNFIRSMDIAHAPTFEAALANYEDAWFSSVKKQYLNEAYKYISEKSLFWPQHLFADMLDEIFLENNEYDDKKLSQDIDIIKSKFIIHASRRAAQSVNREDMIKAIKSFETKYKYSCPDSFKTAWMNTGAYITLSYDIKYNNLIFPKCNNADESLAFLKKLALEVLNDMDHNVDTRLFKLCYMIYKPRA